MMASLRPRVSLLSGAVFVLVTLFLPIAYNSCGPNKTGLEFLSGATGDFPLLAGLASVAFGRGFYPFALVFAAITLVLVLLSWVQPKALRGRRFLKGLYAVSGTISLYLLGDATCFMLGWLVGGILESTLHRDDTQWAAGFGVILVVVALFLRSNLLRRSRLILSLLTAGIAACLLLLFDYFASLVLISGFMSERQQIAILIFLASLYWFVPAYLWYCFGLRRRLGEEGQWPGIRTKILKVYLPALACVPVLFWLVADEHVWGFIPFSIGIHLMSLGYMRLARTAVSDPRSEAATASLPSPAPS
jgi:hypothetical protein